jgi:hypothetical protein
LLALAVALVACESPPEGARLVDGAAAQAAVLEVYGHKGAPLLPVYTVSANCVSMGEPGFSYAGGCRGGYTILGVGIYIVGDGFNVFHRHLPHEVMHASGVDHDGLPTWPAGEITDKIHAAEFWLWTHPELDHIAECPRAK